MPLFIIEHTLTTADNEIDPAAIERKVNEYIRRTPWTTVSTARARWLRAAESERQNNIYNSELNAAYEADQKALNEAAQKVAEDFAYDCTLISGRYYSRKYGGRNDVGEVRILDRALTIAIAHHQAGAARLQAAE